MDTWTFAHVSDIQPGSPRSYRYNASWIENWREAKAQLLDLDPELLLFGGDLTRDGCIHRFEFEEMKPELDSLPFPVYMVPGNTDTGNKHTRIPGLHRGRPDQCEDIDINVTSAQLQTYTEMVGPLWWSVDHKNVRFSGLTDVLVNSGLPEEVQFWQWAEEQVARSRQQYHVWIMHSPLFIERVDEPNWDISGGRDQYLGWYFSVDLPGRARLHDLFKSTGATIVISGHVHCHKVTYVDGIRYEISPSTAFGQWEDRWPDGDATLGFLRYDVSDSGIECTFVPLRKSYKLESYGPGGHPAPHARDYSLAWQKG